MRSISTIVLLLKLSWIICNPAAQESLPPENLTQGNITQGNITQGNITQGYITQGSITHGGITQGSIPQNSITQEKATPKNIPENNISQALRTDREIIEEQFDDDFPILHDYFFEYEEGYNDEGRRDFSNEFLPLCQNVRRRIEMRSDIYEYYPSHYVETVCRKFTTSGETELSRSSYNQMCSQSGFRCVQRTQTLYLTRRRYDSDCWENTKEIVASGCDCLFNGRF